MLEAARVRGADVNEVYVAVDRDLDEPDAVPLAAGVLERIADTKTPQGVVALVIDPVRAIDGGGFDDLAPGPILLAVDINDPGNAGTMIRSAEAAGCAAVVFAGNSVDPRNPKVVRSSAGSIFGVRVVEADDPITTIERLRATGRSVIGAVATGGTPPEQLALDGEVVVAVGSEAHGLSSEVTDVLDARVTIPMVDATESLNVAMAATVLVFEAARQRRSA